MSKSVADLRSFSFVLAVPNLERSAPYFCAALGFRLEWPEGSDGQLVSRDGVRIMMGHCADALAPSATGDHSRLWLSQRERCKGTSRRIFEQGCHHFAASRR